MALQVQNDGKATLAWQEHSHSYHTRCSCLITPHQKHQSHDIAQKSEEQQHVLSLTSEGAWYGLQLSVYRNRPQQHSAWSAEQA